VNWKDDVCRYLVAISVCFWRAYWSFLLAFSVIQASQNDSSLVSGLITLCCLPQVIELLLVVWKRWLVIDSPAITCVRGWTLSSNSIPGSIIEIIQVFACYWDTEELVHRRESTVISQDFFRSSDTADWLIHSMVWSQKSTYGSHPHKKNVVGHTPANPSRRILMLRMKTALENPVYVRVYIYVPKEMYQSKRASQSGMCASINLLFLSFRFHA